MIDRLIDSVEPILEDGGSILSSFQNQFFLEYRTQELMLQKWGFILKRNSLKIDVLEEKRDVFSRFDTKTFKKVVKT